MITRSTIRDWHVVIAGFTQETDAPTGCEQAWLAMRSLISARTQVELRTWDMNASALAERIARLEGDVESRVNVYGYSWGGYTATLLAEELHTRGIGVKTMVLCDPVYRAKTWLGDWRAFFSQVEIPIPVNVAEVVWFRQFTDPRLRGHDLAAESDGTFMHPATVLKLNHCDMDKALPFQVACIQAARALENSRAGSGAA